MSNKPTKDRIMKALVFNAIGSIALKDMPQPAIIQPTDVIVKLTMTSICGTDLHLVRGTIGDMKPGTILGHEGVGIISDVGSQVIRFKQGDRVIIPSTICCGNCAYCMQQEYSQCDKANPNGPLAGTAFYGSPITCGAFNGMQAEYVRVPLADSSLVACDKRITDTQALLLSDILPTAAMAVEYAQIKPGVTTAVFGLGPVGQLIIMLLKQMGNQTIIGLDSVPERLALAQRQGATPIDISTHDPLEALFGLTQGVGATSVIDAVGIDAMMGPIARVTTYGSANQETFNQEIERIVPEQSRAWQPGSGPSQVLRWAAQTVAKAGTISIAGVYSPLLESFPIGLAMEKNVTIRMGNCNHKKYIPELVRQLLEHSIDPDLIITHHLPFEQIEGTYQEFNDRQHGMIKVALRL